MTMLNFFLSIIFLFGPVSQVNNAAPAEEIGISTAFVEAYMNQNDHVYPLKKIARLKYTSESEAYTELKLISDKIKEIESRKNTF